MSSVVEILKNEDFLGDDVFGNPDPDMSPKASEGRKSAPSSPDRKLKRSAVSEFKVKEMNGELAAEPLLTPNPHRFVLFPIQHKDVSTIAR